MHRARWLCCWPAWWCKLGSEAMALVRVVVTYNLPSAGDWDSATVVVPRPGGRPDYIDAPLADANTHSLPSLCGLLAIASPKLLCLYLQ